jgi:hypothetical protein
MTELTIREDNDGVIFSAKIVPASSRTAIAGLLDGMVKIKVAAPPEKGKANQLLLSFLAKELGVKTKALSIISGQRNAVKQIKIAGISTQTLQEKLRLNK